MHIKLPPIILIILFFTTFQEVSSTCSPIDILADLPGACSGPRSAVTPATIPNWPSGGSKQLTIRFTLNGTTENPDCPDTFKTIFKISWKSITYAEMLLYASPSQYNFNFGGITSRLQGTFLETVTIALSFDLETRRVAVGVKEFNTKYEIGDLLMSASTFDSNTQICIGSDCTVATTALNVQDIRIFYKFYDEYGMNGLLNMGSTAPTLVANYPMNEGSGYVINNMVTSSPSLGVGYLGQSTAAGANLANAPTWQPPVGLYFDTTQKVVLPSMPATSPQPFWANSITVSFQLKIPLAGYAGPIISRTTSVDQNNNLTTAVYNNNPVASNCKIPADTWVLITFHIHSENPRQTAPQNVFRTAMTLYMNDVPCLDIISSNMFTIPNTISTDKQTDIFQIGGGFRGAMHSLKIYWKGSGLLYKDTCLSSCQFGTGADDTCLLDKCMTPSNDDYYCSPCDPSCARCTGAGTNACYTCSMPSATLSSGKCTACTTGQFPDYNTKTCQLCDTSCTTCSGSTSNNCTACADPTKYLVSGTCQICPSNQYSDATTQTCKTCHETCATCSGSGEEACTSCPVGRMLSSGKCLPCANNLYSQGSAISCRVCDAACATCSVFPSNCISCSAPKVLKNSQCLSANLILKGWEIILIMILFMIQYLF